MNLIAGSSHLLTYFAFLFHSLGSPPPQKKINIVLNTIVPAPTCNCDTQYMYRTLLKETGVVVVVLVFCNIASEQNMPAPDLPQKHLAPIIIKREVNYFARSLRSLAKMEVTSLQNKMCPPTSNLPQAIFFP